MNVIISQWDMWLPVVTTLVMHFIQKRKSIYLLNVYLRKWVEKNSTTAIELQDGAMYCNLGQYLA